MERQEGRSRTGVTDKDPITYHSPSPIGLIEYLINPERGLKLDPSRMDSYRYVSFICESGLTKRLDSFYTRYLNLTVKYMGDLHHDVLRQGSV